MVTLGSNRRPGGLPPAEVTGEIHEFDTRIGGYRVFLFYPPGKRTFRGKMSDS